jgi:hypothetical protein
MQAIEVMLLCFESSWVVGSEVGCYCLSCNRYDPSDCQDRCDRCGRWKERERDGK